MISREQAEKYHLRARLPALEQSPADDGHLIGRDPRRMSTAELTALGHQTRPLLAVIRVKCLDCVGYEPSEVRKCVAADCALWPYRMAYNPFREISEAQREQGRRLAARRLAGGSPSECPANPETPETAEGEMAYAPADDYQAVSGSSQDLVTAIEADQMFDFLRRREMPPAGRQVGDARHARERNDAAVVETDALLARSLERRACHRLGTWSMLGARASRSLARACEGRRWAPTPPQGAAGMAGGFRYRVINSAALEAI